MPPKDPKAPADASQKPSSSPRAGASIGASAGASNTRLRVAHLDPNRPTPVDIAPDHAARAKIAERLGLIDLGRLHLTGALRAEGTQDWVFKGQLTANAVQKCVVTLGPVNTVIDAPVTRRWSPDQPKTDADEMEMPENVADPLGAFIDLGAVAVEELSLLLPDFPRRPGAALPGAVTEEEAPPQDTTRRPFAGLDKLLADRDT